MKQSDSRVPGRRQSGPPPSFGRQAEPEPEQERDFSVVGGEAFHLVLHIEAVPTAQSMEDLYNSVRSAVAAAVRDGYAEAIAAMEDEAGAGEAPGDGKDGGPSPG